MIRPTRIWLTSLTAVVAASLHWTALAEGGSAETRAKIKAETGQALREHRLAPAGENALPLVVAPARSTKSREQRKAETLAARRAGEIAPAGESAMAAADRRLRGARSEKSRALVKKQTADAARAMELVPAGEGPGAPRK